MIVSSLAGKPAAPPLLENVPALVTAYYTETPDPSVAGQRVAFGRSGHRGLALGKAFNEAHVIAMTQAICLYRARQRTGGPTFLGMDTHALSVPTHATALEVLAANGVSLMIAERDEYTPTPAVSHAILTSAPGDGHPIGGIKVTAGSGWFAARRSGTEKICRIYVESYRRPDHPRRVLEEAQTIVSNALAAAPRQGADDAAAEGTP